ncbi:hypothetical protein MBLNU457_g0111t1 [Dothideomycetes sp. NU457]
MTKDILRASSLILLALSTCLSLAVLGTAADVLRSFNNEKNINPWWLPIWPQHFNTAGLQTLLSISATIAVLNIIAGVLIFKTQTASRIASALIYTLLTILSTSLAFLASVVGVVYPAILDHQSPGRDTMQTWTCRWAEDSSTITAISSGVPSNFGRLCTESKFAYFTSIPIMLLQISILGLTIWSLLTTRKVTREGKENSSDSDREPAVTVVELPKYECRIESPESL